MKRFTLLLLGMCLIATGAWSQKEAAPAAKATHHAGVKKWERTPEYLPDVETSGFGDPRNPVSDPWGVSVNRTTAFDQGGENSLTLQRGNDGSFKHGNVPATDDDAPALRSSVAIQPLIDVEVGSTYSAGNSSVPDGCSAVSWNGYNVVSNNTHVQFIDEDGTILYNQGEDTFWSVNSPTANIYDPKVLYNASQNKFILMALHGSSNSLSELYIAFSVSSNPMDGWWYYKLTANPSSLSSWWFDYPSIGHSGEDLFISGNMFTNAGSYQATAMFIIEMLDGFVGGTISSAYWDDVNDPDGVNNFTVKPLQYPFGVYGPGIYCAAWGNDLSSYNYYDVTDNLSGSPTLAAYNVDAPDWTEASDASQLGSTRLLDTGGSRIRSGFYGGDGILHIAHAVERGTSGYSELRYAKIDVNAGTAVKSDFGLDDWDYSYPWIVPWATNAATWDGGVMVGFLRVSSNSYPEFRCVHMDGTLTWGGSVGIRSGSSPITANSTGTNRWGDYIGGGWREGQSTPEVWLYGQYGQSNDHACWLAEVVGDIEGCTDAAACNYNPAATLNVGCEYDSCAGCMSETACNYDAGATIDDGSCTFPGCTDLFACNYDATAGCNDGSCCYGTCIVVDMEADGLFGGNDLSYTITDNASGSVVITGTNSFITTSQTWCMDPGCYTFDITTEQTDAAWTLRIDPVFIIFGADYTIYEGTGNFSGEFIVGDGGDASGCTDPSACNYDATVICDNGSCCYESCLTVDMTDSFGDGWNGNVWEVTDPADGSVVATGTLENGSAGVDITCLEAGCYDFSINTSDGSFLTEVGWTLLGTDEDVDPTGSYDDTATFTIGGGGTDYDCTDPAACNYSAVAICDDGSCCYTNCAVLTKTDSFGDGWNGGYLEMYDSEGNLIQTFEMLSGNQEIEEFCLDDGCYSMVFVPDFYPEEVGWTLSFVNNGNMIGGGGFYNDSFSVNGVDGCTNPDACNYDSAATCDDGSCDLGLWYLPNEVNSGVPVVQACEAPAGYYLAVQSCIEEVIAADPYCVNTEWDSICMRAYNCCLGIYGCGDPAACNYDLNACWDNTYCEYAGCIDPYACNYDAAAGCDDGSCDYACVGCTYDTAENYDPAATIEDGSCTFAPCSVDCPGDLNGDGEIGAPDLLVILGGFGTVCP